MALTINTNIASVSAQRHLNESRKDLDIAMERLSSGQRINSAKDDAAGLAIRDKMSSQIVGLNQSIRNANDAISLAQTAEGAMEESVSILQRMRVLAMQAINDTNTDSDRANLNDEFDQLKLELTRIGITSSFNNVKLLDGTFTGSTFQVGPGASETIFLKIGDQKANAIGTTYDVASFDIFAADTPAKGDSLSLTIRGADGDGGDLTVTYTSDKAETATYTAAGMVLALNSNSTFSQKYQALTDANNSILIRRTDGTSMGLPIRAQFDVNAAAANDTVTITVDGVDTGGAAKTFTYTSDAAETAFEVATGVAAKLNADETGFGRFYKAYASSEGKVEIRAKDGTNVDTSQITVSQAVSNSITYSTHSSTSPSEVVVAPPSTQSTTYNTHASTPPSPVVTTPAASAVVGGEFQVNTTTIYSQNNNSVTALNDGGFVATWNSWHQDGSDDGVFGQRYDSAGAKAGAEFQVNTYTSNEQSFPSITALNDGGFVATWSSVYQDGDTYGVYGQRYDSTGAKAGAEFQVNTYTNSAQHAPSITALNDGGFVVTWQSNGQDGDGWGVFGQRYDSAGLAVTTGSTTGVSTLDFSSLGLNAGDRITLNITGGSNVTGVIGSAGLDALLTSMASDVAAQTGLFSAASSSSGVLTLSGLTDGSAMAAVTVSLEEDTITPAVTGSNSLNFSSLSLNAGDRITLTIAGGTQVQGTIGSAGLDALLTTLASDVAAQTDFFSGASASSGVLTLNGLTDGSAMAAVTVSLEASTLESTTINQIINEHTGFEISVSPALNSQGALSVSNVVKAVDVFVDDTDILSASAAMQAVRVVDDAVAMIGRERAGLGAFQNRLGHAMSNMANNAQNTQAARSVIADADYSMDAAKLAKNQILQQAGTAMLAQANSQAETVLNLLK